MKKTKIICTIGPSCYNEETLREMIYEGMDVARINMSHATFESAKKSIETIRGINAEIGTNVAILVDTKGPEIRVRGLEDSTIELKKNTEVYITTKEVKGTPEIFGVDYPGLARDLDINDKILLDDGSISLKVIKKDENTILAMVLNDGILANKKSVNVPEKKLRLPFLSDKDKLDIKFALEVDADFLALSYVSDMEDVLRVKDIVTQHNNKHMQIIAKIENSTAANDIKNIIRVSDGVMIARGDLGVEMPFELLPGIQKGIIELCHKQKKVSIVATQMLESMIKSNRPTRAEVTDIYNAVMNGTDAIMLSGETTVGEYPVESVKVMSKISVQAENEIDYFTNHRKFIDSEEINITSAIASSVVNSSYKLRASAIVAATNSGYTAKVISNQRPSCPIIATTPNERTARSLALSFGVKAVLVPLFTDTDEIIKNAKEMAIEILKIQTNETIVITGGFPLLDVKHTNFLKIVQLG